MVGMLELYYEEKVMPITLPFIHKDSKILV